MRPSVPSTASTSNTDELESLRRKVAFVLSVVFALWVGFRFAISVYSGPSPVLALEFIAGGATVVGLLLAFLPKNLGTALVYLLTFLR